MTTTPRTFEVRHLQLARAAAAAIAAVMITFSSDHSAAVGHSVFSGFAVTTGLALLLAAWLVFPAGERGASVLLGSLFFLAGMASSIPAWRTDVGFFVIVIAWALLTGLVEIILAARARRSAAHSRRPHVRDGVVVGGLTALLGALLLLVDPGFALDYTVDGNDFTLTGTIIGVGLFGGYAAIVAVYLAISALTPRRALPAVTDIPGQDAASAPSGGSA